jgi:hypothetical protein
MEAQALLVSVEIPWQEIPLPWLKTCFKCGRPNCTQQCSICRIARYCSAECQKAHWKIHKKVCKVDLEDGMAKVKFRNFSEECFHEVFPTPEVLDVEQPVMDLSNQINLIPDVFVLREGREEAMLILERFCALEPAASSPLLPRIFVINAADALQDKNYVMARNFLGMAFYLEAFQMNMLAGLSVDLHRTDTGAADSPGRRHLTETADGTMTIKGIFEHICKRVNCRCFET